MAAERGCGRPRPRRKWPPVGVVTWSLSPAVQAGLGRKALRAVLAVTGLVAAGRVIAPSACQRRGAVLVTAALMLAACSGGANVTLPGKTTPPAVPPSPPSPAPSGGAAVQAAYVASWAASDQAERSGNAARARAILAPYVTPADISTAVAGMSPYWARHEVAWGYVTPHITAVRLYGRYAAVADCQDASRHALADARTGRVIAGTYGSPHAELYASLTLGGDGRWRVGHITFMGTSCTPPRS